MKKILAITIFTLISLYTYSQAQITDSLKEVLDKHEGKLNALDERVLVNETDLGKLNKLKISGYVQAQWLLNDKDHVTVNEPTNSFLIRRARLKFTYEPLDGVKFVVQPDFSTNVLRCNGIIAGDHDDPDTRFVAFLHGNLHFRPNWIGQTDEPNEFKFEIMLNFGQRFYWDDRFGHT